MGDLIIFIIIAFLYISIARVIYIYIYIFEKQKHIENVMIEYDCSYKQAESYYEQDYLFVLFFKSLFWIFWLPVLFISNFILKLINKNK